MFSKVFRGTVVGRIIKPRSAGEEPKCVTEEKMATLSIPSEERVPIRLADLKPEQEFNKLIL